jgi:GMP synthase (glutamine-hydrolysing)
MLVVDNEVDRAYDYLPAALRDLLPAHDVVRPPDGDAFPDPAAVADLDAVVLTGSTAGTYETDAHPWMDAERAFVRRLVDAGVPTLGVCFGHQLVNDALGGRVEHRGLTARLVDVAFDDAPLFEGVASTVPMVHGDHVVAAGEGMEPVARADYYPLLATRHRRAPVRTVQYHPEFTASLRERVAADFDWRETDLRFADVTTDRTVRNFLDLAGVDAEGYSSVWKFPTQ